MIPLLREIPVRLWLHLAGFIGLLAVGALVLVWPQWLVVASTRAALEFQHEQIGAVKDRIDLARTVNVHLRKWQTDDRRVFVETEIPALQQWVTRLAQQEGAMLTRYEFEQRRSPRWRPVSVSDDVAAVADPEFRASEGILRPVAVRMSFRGGFPQVYRTIAGLTSQRRLIVVDRWQVRQTDDGAVAADAVATIFVIRVPENVPDFPTASTQATPASPGVRG